jgi:hypothetical protein
MNSYSIIGVSDALWYPDFVDQSNSCINNGFEPSYMKQNDSYYLFLSKQECCDQWFSYNPFCMTSSSSKEKFFPDYSTGMCSVKKEKEFETWELERYDSLEECCASKFSVNFESCCSAFGLDGCSTTETMMYLPDWNDGNCIARSKSSLATWEEIYSSTSASVCCTDNFGYRKKECCKESGC